MVIGIDASRTFVFNATGTERYAAEVTEKLLCLSKSKIHKWVLYCKPENFEALRLKFNKHPNVQIVQIRLKYLWTQFGLAARTWIDRLDVLWVPAHTLPVWRKPGVKTVVTIHGLEYEWLPAYQNLLQKWYLPLSTIYACKSANRVIAVSRFTKKQIVERIGVDKEKINVIYEGYSSGTSLSDLPPRLGGRCQWGVLEKFGLKPKQYLLFIGTIQPRKNLVRLIEAFSRLNMEFKLVIAGKWGWLYDEVKEVTKKFGVEDGVVFTGYINDTEREILLQNALVYVQPSITEGFGLPVLEAMAAGVPVVSSEGGALREILTFPSISLLSLGKGRKGEVRNTAGLLFDPYSVSDMASKIKLIIGDKKLRTELINRGKKRVKDFSWNKAAVETYNTLTSKL